MSDNMTLKMDPDTYDISFDENGFLETIDGDATTAQNVRMTLLAWRGEFPLDTAHGTGYEQYLGVPKVEANDIILREVIREAIFQETEVSSVDGILLEAEDREMHIAFSGTLKNGQTVRVEVKR